MQENELTIITTNQKDPSKCGLDEQHHHHHHLALSLCFTLCKLSIQRIKQHTKQTQQASQSIPSKA